MCKKEPETILHCLRVCEKARSIWKEVGPGFTNVLFFADSLEDWLTKNISVYPSLNILNGIGDL